MNRKIDVVIPVAEKDVETAVKNFHHFFKNLPVKNIVIVGNKAVGNKMMTVTQEYDKVAYVDENTVCPGMNFQTIKKIITNRAPKASRKTGWYFQQFIKMAYAYLCEDENYLVWDSDTIPLHKLDFITEDGKLLYNIKNSRYQAYFNTIDTLFPENLKTLPDDGSFITEHMIFNVEIMKGLIEKIEKNATISGERFYEKILNAIDAESLPLSGFSEFETYGTFMLNYYPDKYRYRKLKYLRSGRVFFGDEITEEELDWAAESYDTISFEHFESEWKIVSWLWRNSYVMNHKALEDIVEKNVGPAIHTYHQFRRFVKELIKR